MFLHNDYPCSPSNYTKGRTQPIKYLVIHYVGATGGAEGNCLYYGRESVGASAHYFVGHAPRCEVWQSVEERDTAWHCGITKGYKHPECRNANSIGIEICCHQDKVGKWYFDPETVDATVELARDIMARYGINTDHVVRHYDVTGKICPAPYVNDLAAWEAFQARLEEDEMTKEEIQAIATEAAKKVLSEYEDAVAENTNRPVSAWAAPQWEIAKAAGVFDGSRPGAALKREEAAIVLDRLGLLE